MMASNLYSAKNYDMYPFLNELLYPERSYDSPIGGMDQTTARLAVRSWKNYAAQIASYVENTFDDNSKRCIYQLYENTETTREMQLREMPYEEAKNEIRQFFNKHPNEDIVPSDIMFELNIEYVLVSRICEELREEGEIE
ncbi:MAG: hypothetical protein HY788_13170 [Deltaproteobacteria bacterium]|nr:hypothetical protein [Deltaproteobacteria bacterium]